MTPSASESWPSPLARHERLRHRSARQSMEATAAGSAQIISICKNSRITGATCRPFTLLEYLSVVPDMSMGPNSQCTSWTLRTSLRRSYGSTDVTDGKFQVRSACSDVRPVLSCPTRPLRSNPQCMSENLRPSRADSCRLETRVSGVPAVGSPLERAPALACHQSKLVVRVVEFACVIASKLRRRRRDL